MDTTTQSKAEWLHFLDDHANPEYADRMKKYLRDKFEFLGINSPRRRELLAAQMTAHPIPSFPEFEQLVRKMWESPYREYHYCAIEMMDRKRKQLKPAQLELLEFVLTTHAWWDTVDLIASHLVGELFKNHPAMIPEVNRRWMESGNLWLQRSCLLFQLMYKQKTDRALLGKNIEALLAENDFFIRKAIGWALRQYARTDSAWVQEFVSKHELSPLSRREALKHLG